MATRDAPFVAEAQAKAYAAWKPHMPVEEAKQWAEGSVIQTELYIVREDPWELEPIVETGSELLYQPPPTRRDEDEDDEDDRGFRGAIREALDNAIPIPPDEDHPGTEEVGVLLAVSDPSSVGVLDAFAIRVVVHMRRPFVGDEDEVNAFLANSRALAKTERTTTARMIERQGYDGVVIGTLSDPIEVVVLDRRNLTTVGRVLERGITLADRLEAAEDIYQIVDRRPEDDWDFVELTRNPWDPIAAETFWAASLLLKRRPADMAAMLFTRNGTVIAALPDDYHTKTAEQQVDLEEDVVSTLGEQFDSFVSLADLFDPADEGGAIPDITEIVFAKQPSTALARLLRERGIAWHLVGQRGTR